MKVILTLAFLALFVGCKTPPINESPTAGFTDPPWVWHKCEKCGSLDGGCYPKRTTISHRTEKGYSCRHEWERIQEDEFNGILKEQTGTDRTPQAIDNFELFGT